MEDFQPLPGVVCDVEFKDGRLPQTLLYAPWGPNVDHPWQDGYGGFYTGKEFDVTAVVYNPHPPTRTEWAVGSDEHWQCFEDEEDARSYLEEQTELLEIPPTWGKRQVTPIEWQEVTE